jgi:hypothetical protein
MLYHAARDATGWATRAVKRMKAKSVVRAKLTKGARVLIQWSNTEQYEATVNSWNRYEDRGIVDYDDGTDSLMTFSRIVKVISVPEQPSSSSSSTSEDRQRNRQRRRRERRIRKRRLRHGPKTDNFTDNGASSERRSKKTRTEPKTSSPSSPSSPTTSPTTSPSSSSSSSSSSNGSKQPNHSDPYLSPGTVYTKRSIEEFKKIVVAVGLHSNDFTTEIKWNEIKVKDHQGNVIRIKQAIKNKINAQHAASHNRTTFRRWWCQYIQVLRTQLPNSIENTTAATTTTATTATTTTTTATASSPKPHPRTQSAKNTKVKREEPEIEVHIQSAKNTKVKQEEPDIEVHIQRIRGNGSNGSGGGSGGGSSGTSATTTDATAGQQAVAQLIESRTKDYANIRANAATIIYRYTGSRYVYSSSRYKYM